MNRNTILVMALGLGAATSAHAALVIGELQATAAPTVSTPIDVVADDLLQTAFGSSVGEVDSWMHDGITAGSAKDGSDNVLWVDAGGALQTDYFFDVSVNVAGYDIEDIRVFSGWDSNRAQVGYDISYSIVGSAAFTLFGTVDSPADQGAANDGSDWSFLTRTYDDAGGTIAGLTGVDAIRFDWDFSDNNGDSATRGAVFKEVDIIGAATIPEPSSFLLGMAGMGLMCLRRVRR